MGVFDFFDFFGLDVVVDVLVVVVYDEGVDYVDEVDCYELLDMLDGGEVEDEGEYGDGEVCGGVFWYVDWLVGWQFVVGGVGFFYVVEGIYVLYFWQFGEVVEWWW